MSVRARELADRLAGLRAQCVAQRQALGGAVMALENRVRAPDRAAAVALGWLRNPAALALGVGMIVLVGRAGGLRLVGRIVLLVTAARRLARAFGR